MMGIERELSWKDQGAALATSLGMNMDDFFILFCLFNRCNQKLLPLML